MPMSSDEPIILMLQHNAVSYTDKTCHPTVFVYSQGNITGANISTLRCVFWNFTLTQNGYVFLHVCMYMPKSEL